MKNNGLNKESGERLVLELQAEWNRLDQAVQPISDLSEQAWEQRIQMVRSEKKRRDSREYLMFFLFSLVVLGGGMFVYRIPYVFAFVQGLGMTIAVGVVAAIVLSGRRNRYER